jgi:hypothetical protein
MRIGRLLGVPVVALLAGLPGIAAGDDRQSYSQVTKLLQVGDTVSITDWDDAKTTGEVAGVTSCSVLLKTGDTRVEIPADHTKLVKRLRRAKPRTVHKTADAGRRCSEILHVWQQPWRSAARPL